MLATGWRPCYTFRNICEENNTVDLSDKSLKVIYNASAYDEEFRSEYAAMNLHDQDIIRIAKKEASEEKAIENAKTMLSDKLSPDKVSHYSGLPLKQVLELQKKIAETVKG